MKLKISVPGIIFSSAFFLLCCILFYMNQLFLPSSVCILPLLFVLFEGLWYLKLCWGIVYTFILNITSWVFYYILIFFHVLNKENLRGWEGHLSDYIFLLSTILVIFALKQKGFRAEKYLYFFRAKDYILIMAVCLINFILSSTTNMLYFYRVSDYGKQFILLFFIVVMPMSMILLLGYFRIQRLYIELDQTNQINVQMLQREEHYYKSIQKKTMDLRAFRHDYRNHLTALKSLADNAQWNELCDYLDHLSDIKENIHYISTNHTVADAILNDYYEQYSLKMDFHVDGKFTDPLFVNDIDLCILLSNLIKNATEACEKVMSESKERPQIFLLIFCNQEELSIKIKNSSLEVPQKQLEYMHSTKDDLFYHGFGILNIKNVLQHYHGVLDMDYSNGQFISTVLLKAPVNSGQTGI